jgi:hypothetical protein
LKITFTSNLNLNKEFDWTVKFKKKNKMERLPQEIILKVLEFLDLYDTSQISYVCKKLFNITKSDEYWRNVKKLTKYQKEIFKNEFKSIKSQDIFQVFCFKTNNNNNFSNNSYFAFCPFVKQGINGSSSLESLQRLLNIIGFIATSNNPLSIIEEVEQLTESRMTKFSKVKEAIFSIGSTFECINGYYIYNEHFKTEVLVFPSIQIWIEKGENNIIDEAEKELEKIYKQKTTFEFFEKTNVLCTDIHKISKPVNYLVDLDLKTNKEIWKNGDEKQKRFEFWFDKYSFNRSNHNRLTKI